MNIFDSKHFNGEVFGKYVETVPRVKQNAFLKAGILRPRPDLKNMLADQTGGNFISVPMSGLIGGTPDNYDGATNITTDKITTYLQSMIVTGRAHSWVERDFTYDVTKKDFMKDIASQVADYWDDVDQETILAILEGIFGVKDDKFNEKHTLDISATDSPNVGPTTLNNCIKQSAGANKGLFKLVIMHSEVATNLENLQILEYAKYTDEKGIEKEVALATWNGRTVLIDDDVPTADNGAGKTKYTTYVLGQNAFDYVDCGAKVPYETDRDKKTNGGEDYLISRQRKLFAPRGFSFVQPKTPIISPTLENLKTASCWAVVKDAEGSKFFNSKAIPFARIISLG